MLSLNERENKPTTRISGISYRCILPLTLNHPITSKYNEEQSQLLCPIMFASRVSVTIPTSNIARTQDATLTSPSYSFLQASTPVMRCLFRHPTIHAKPNPALLLTYPLHRTPQFRHPSHVQSEQRAFFFLSLPPWSIAR